MQVTYRPGGAGAAVEVRDLTGGSPHATWTPGETREIGDDHTTMVREADGTIVRKRTLDALFAAGPNFVDAATGTNPLYVSARSGKPTTDEGFFHATPSGIEFVRYVDADGGRLTMDEFLEDHPEHVDRHARMPGMPADRIATARKAHAARTATASEQVAAGAPQPDVTPEPPVETYDRASFDLDKIPDHTDHEDHA